MSDNTVEIEQKDYTASSLATAAGVHFTHIARLCRDGKLDCRKFGNYWVIPHTVGAAFIAEREKAKAEKP